MPEGGECEKGLENLTEEIMAENFLILVKKKDTQFRKDRVSVKMNPKRPTLRHIIKLAKLEDKETTLKPAEKRQSDTYKGASIRISADFSTQTLWPKEMLGNIRSDES